MNKKKAQVSVFIILSVLFIIFFLILINNNINSKKESITKESPDKEFNSLSLENLAASCLEKNAKESLHDISQKGGYHNAPKESLNISGFEVAYYWQINKSLMPEIKTIEKELSESIKSKIVECINQSIKKEQYNPDFKNILLNSSILEDKIILDLDTGIIIQNSAQQKKLKKIRTSIKSNFSKQYSIIKEIIKEQKKNPDWVPIGFIINKASENNFRFINTEIDDDKIIFSLIFKEDKEPLIYSFAAKYNWEEEYSKDKTQRIIEKKAYTGYKFSYKIEPEIKNAQFSDFTELFDISKDGLIEFVPQKKDEGKHSILISSKNSIKKETIIFRIEIINENSSPIIKKIEDIKINITKNPLLNINVSTQDKNNEIIFYSLESSIKNMSINLLTGKIKHNLSNTQEGNYTITIIATNSKGAHDKKHFNLEVIK